MDKKLILVAEDDRFIADIFQKKLDKAGYEVVVVPNGELALEKAKEKKPDLIILDLIMPVKDGFETLKDLKVDKDLKEVKVVVFSNLGQENDIKIAKDLGADDFFIKADITVEKMLEIVQHYLS